MSKNPYFYYQSRHYIVPFECPGIHVRMPNERETELFKYDTSNEDGGCHITLEDNGDSGDGIILEISTEVSKSSIFWGRLSVSGVKAIREALDNILKMREIEDAAQGGAEESRKGGK